MRYVKRCSLRRLRFLACLLSALELLCQPVQIKGGLWQHPCRGRSGGRARRACPNLARLLTPAYALGPPLVVLNLQLIPFLGTDFKTTPNAPSLSKSAGGQRQASGVQQLLQVVKKRCLRTCLRSTCSINSHARLNRAESFACAGFWSCSDGSPGLIYPWLVDRRVLL